MKILSMRDLTRYFVMVFTWAAIVVSFLLISTEHARAQTPSDQNFDGVVCQDNTAQSLAFGDWTFVTPNLNVTAVVGKSGSYACTVAQDLSLNTDEPSNSGDRSLYWGYSGDTGEFSFKSTNGAEFDLVALDFGIVAGSASSSFDVSGYKNGVLVTAVEKVTFTTSNSDNAGEVTHGSVQNGGTGPSARLIFGAAYNEIDEVRFNISGSALEVDNIDVEPVASGASSDATLSNLVISQGTLSPAFSSGTTSYTASVANSVTEFTVTPTVNEGTATVTVNGTTVTSGSASSAISLNVGANTITTVVTAGDGTTTQTYTITVTRAAAAPTVTAINPTSGPTAGGTSVVITGTNFTGATAVSFGGTAATGYTVDSATQITATAPAGSAGAVNVAVTTAGGTATATGAYTYVAAPTVTAVSPTSGATAGGTSVVITGTNFTGATAVSFGGTAASSYTVDSATQITATAPAGSAGAVNVAVTTAGGTATAAGAYTYVAAPTVTSLSPTSGATAGGTSVVITGTNFTGATAVSFGGTAASSFTVDSATQITATAPAGSAGSVNVAVTTAGGTATATGAYTYVSAPSSDATLSSLLLSQGTLSPAFSSGTTSYTASVSNAVSSLTITPTVSEGTATITVNGVAVSSGSASGAISLNVGSNTITTIVTAGDSTTTQTYTTTVARAAASQTITFNNPGAQNFGTTPTLTATATSGLIVSFSSQTNSVCTVTNGGALTFLDVGTCTIDADQAGDSSYSAATTVTQSFAVNAVVPSAPTIGTATAGDGQATVTFTAPASNGGAAITGYTVTSNPGGFTGTGSSSPITVTGLTNGTIYTFTVTATNSTGTSVASAASNSVTPAATATPATEFTSHLAEIREVIVNDASRNLRSNLTVNRNMVIDARERFIEMRLDTWAIAGQQPLDFGGTFDAAGNTISTKGTFFGAQILGNGIQRLVFGDFDIQHEGDTGSSTATLTGRVAWEQMTSGQTLLGYFVGGELAQSNLAGAFSGDQNRVGVTIGGYTVHELAKNTYLDGFVTLGAGRNNLEMADNVLALESDYTTRSVTFGGALSSVIEQPGYEIWPELSFSYGRTWIGGVDFTGRAYGLVDNTLSLDAGSVTLANIMFRPEFRVPLDGLSAADSLQLFTFAPRLICEQIKATVTEENCGGGAEIGLTGMSADGLSTYSAKVSADRLGNRTNSSLQLNLEHRF